MRVTYNIAMICNLSYFWEGYGKKMWKDSLYIYVQSLMYHKVENQPNS